MRRFTAGLVGMEHDEAGSSIVVQMRPEARPDDLVALVLNWGDGQSALPELGVLTKHRFDAGVTAEIRLFAMFVGDDYIIQPTKVIGVQSYRDDVRDTTYLGRAFDDVIAAGSGDDRLQGRDGNDYLSGGSGNDQMFGGRGSDTLEGGLGTDILSGGADRQRDVFVFDTRRMDVHDHIVDFEAGIDKIRISGLRFFEVSAAEVEFVAGGRPAPTGDAKAALLYDTDNGRLYLDPDGAGSAVREQVAILVGAPALSLGDFELLG